jgi:hypothetical protein
MEIVLGEGLPFFGEDRGFIPDHIHIFGKLKVMLGHRRREVSVVTGWKIDGTEREGDGIGFERYRRRSLVGQGRNDVVVVPAVCEDRGYHTDAGEQSEECLTHKTSQE